MAPFRDVTNYFHQKKYGEPKLIIILLGAIQELWQLVRTVAPLSKDSQNTKVNHVRLRETRFSALTKFV